MFCEIIAVMWQLNVCKAEARLSFFTSIYLFPRYFAPLCLKKYHRVVGSWARRGVENLNVLFLPTETGALPGADEAPLTSPPPPGTLTLCPLGPAGRFSILCLCNLQ